MTFFIVVLRSLWRRPVRTGLTLVGISIGIGAVVALVGMSRGFETSWTTGLKSRGTDIVVNNLSSGLTPKAFPASARDRIAHLPGIAGTCAIQVEFMSLESAEMAIVSAREWGAFSWDSLKLVSGRMPRDAHEKAVVLGTAAAEMLKKKVGNPIQIETEELSVVGIVDGGAVVENGAVILSLPVLQEIMGTEDKINGIDIRVNPGTSDAQIHALCDRINALIPEAKARPVSENIRNSQGFKIINAMSWATSLLAVLVGVLGVMNTMLMTVFERKQELAILLALGWRKSRIIRLILWESALLGLFGGILGSLVGVVGMKVLEHTPTIRGLLKPDLSVGLVLFSIAVAILVGLLSGLYPAWRSSRLSPSLALQA